VIVTDRYIVNEDFQPKGEYGEIAVSKGQTVEILGRPPGSRSWRVRIMDCDVTGDTEGLVPYSFLRKMEEAPLRNKRSSVETLHSQSSEGKNIFFLGINKMILNSYYNILQPKVFKHFSLL